MVAAFRSLTVCAFLVNKLVAREREKDTGNREEFGPQVPSCLRCISSQRVKSSNTKTDEKAQKPCEKPIARTSWPATALTAGVPEQHRHLCILQANGANGGE